MKENPCEGRGCFPVSFLNRRELPAQPELGDEGPVAGHILPPKVVEQATAASKKTTVLEVPVFSRSNGGGALGKVPAVIEAAFSQDVLDGRLSPIVEVEKGRGVVLRATDHKLPQQKPLDAVRTEVVAAWKKQRGVELAAVAAADAVKRLTAGEPCTSSRAPGFSRSSSEQAWHSAPARRCPWPHMMRAAARLRSADAAPRPHRSSFPLRRTRSLPSA